MDIDLAEALWRLGELPVSQLQEIALGDLFEGHYGGALLELAEAPLATRRDVGDLFERALAEMGRAPISESEAARRAARDVASKILAGDMDPYRGASMIWWQFYERAGQPPELRGFVGLASQYEDDPQHRAEYLEDIVGEAKDLLR